MTKDESQAKTKKWFLDGRITLFKEKIQHKKDSIKSYENDIEVVKQNMVQRQKELSSLEEALKKLEEELAE